MDQEGLIKQHYEERSTYEKKTASIRKKVLEMRKEIKESDLWMEDVGKLLLREGVEVRENVVGLMVEGLNGQAGERISYGGWMKVLSEGNMQENKTITYHTTLAYTLYQKPSQLSLRPLLQHLLLARYRLIENAIDMVHALLPHHKEMCQFQNLDSFFLHLYHTYAAFKAIIYPHNPILLRTTPLPCLSLIVQYSHKPSYPSSPPQPSPKYMQDTRSQGTQEYTPEQTQYAQYPHYNYHILDGFIVQTDNNQESSAFYSPERTTVNPTLLSKPKKKRIFNKISQQY